MLNLLKTISIWATIFFVSPAFVVSFFIFGDYLLEKTFPRYFKPQSNTEKRG